jgi:hypothetical protein
MIVDELISLLRLGKLGIKKHSFFYSLHYYDYAASERIHIHLRFPEFLLSWGWKLEEAGTGNVLYEGKKCKELYKELEIYRKMSERDKTEKARETVQRVLSGELDKIINSDS